MPAGIEAAAMSVPPSIAVPERAEPRAGALEGAQALQCLEVWGGNGVIDNGVTMAGIDAWVFSRPYEGTDSGGDVHYVSTCGTGRISRMMVADVAGHGPTASAAAVGLRNLMRRHVNHLDQTRLVSMLNRQFGGLASEGVFATAVVATFFAPTGSFVAVTRGTRGRWSTARGRGSGG